MQNEEGTSEVREAYGLLFSAHAAIRAIAEERSAAIDRLHELLIQICDVASKRPRGQDAEEALHKIEIMVYDIILSRTTRT